MTTPSSIVRDLDPAVERVILRCLEKDPERRPASALPWRRRCRAAIRWRRRSRPGNAIAGHARGGGGNPRAPRSVRCRRAVTFVARRSVRRTLPAHLHCRSRAARQAAGGAGRSRAADSRRCLGYPGRPQDQAYGFTFADGLHRVARARRGSGRTAGNRSLVELAAVAASFW